MMDRGVVRASAYEGAEDDKVYRGDVHQLGRSKELSVLGGCAQQGASSARGRGQRDGPGADSVDERTCARPVLADAEEAADEDEREENEGGAVESRLDQVAARAECCASDLSACAAGRLRYTE